MGVFRAIIALIYSTLISIYVIALISVLCGYVFTMAWNYVIPKISELPVLTYWEGMAIIFMSRILTNNSIVVKTESNNEQKN